MDFNQYLDQAWTDHVADSAQVAKNFQFGIDLLKESSQISDLAHLITHVTGEHLAQWSEGIRWLEKLKGHALTQGHSESQQALKRSIAILEVTSGIRNEVKDFSLSDQIRILCTAASAAVVQKSIQDAKALLQQALELAQVGLSKEDPANRSLAVAGNNLSANLGERAQLTPEEKNLMIFAGQVSRKYWEIAGTWKEVKVAEYRLSEFYFKLEKWDQSFEHAQNCVEICESNQASNLYFFYAYEVLAQAERARHNTIGFQKAFEHLKQYFEKLIDGEKAKCEAILKKFTP